MLAAFRQHYPQGGLVSELLRIHDGLYIVRAAVVVENQTLATGLAAHGVLETAEDTASVRALSHIGLAGLGDAAGTLRLAGPPPDSPMANSSSKAPQPAPSVASPTVDMADGVVPSVADPLPSLNFGLDTVDLEPEIYAAHTLTAVGPAPELASPPKAVTHSNLMSVEPLAEEAPVIPLPFETDLLSLEGIPTPSIDLSDIIAQTDVELQRLGWNVNQGREFLEKTYGKRSRHDLTDEELLEFLLFLETQPTPGH
jgi:hypothetical protein